MLFLDEVYISEAVNGLARDYKYCISELFDSDIYVGRKCKNQESNLWLITLPKQFVYWYKNLLELNCFLNMLGKTELCKDDILSEIRYFSKVPG